MHVAYPGSFDPPTLGHLSMIERAASLFERLTIIVAFNPDKNSFLNADERVDLLVQSCKHLKNVHVIKFSGLLVDGLKEINSDAIIKGIRTADDLHNEQLMAETNRVMSGIETIFFPSEGKYQFISSSLIKQIFTMGGSVKPFLPENVHTYLLNKHEKS